MFSTLLFTRVCQSSIAKLNVSRVPAEHDPVGRSTQHAYFSRDNRRAGGKGATHYCIVQFDRIPKSFRFCDAATRGAQQCALRPFSPGYAVTHQTFSWTSPTLAPVVLLLLLERASSRHHGGLCGGSFCDEYCRGRLLFPLTNHPPMSRGGRAAMFYSPSVDRVDNGGSSRLVCARETMSSPKGPSSPDGKTYRCHYVPEILFD